ncbi:putative exonuclease [Dickeya phage vB_DsoM_JA13]|uniref:Putative exonuclease n=1 Tax=Dickeya phage vB_DsoM_JA13 TaxID=2283030 RepID=A0A384ZWH6_9CAUD|nr:putative exonuclease [Dickeya phage vB_DsoM_JA13]
MALDVTVPEKRYPKKRVSPSMFPICSIQEYAARLYEKHNKHLSGESGTMLNIFAKAGTGMHESIQNALGNTGQMVGHWKCSNPDCEEHPKTKSVYENGKRIKKGKHTRTHSCDNICPKCKKPMAYSELKVLYKSLKGYVDGLIDNLDGTYSLIDLKSTTVTKAADGTFFVKYHRYQIATYAYILKKRYGYNIVDYTLVYVPRDNPKKFVEKSFVFDEAESKIAYKFMMKQIRAWDAVMKSVRKKDPSYAIEKKPCKSPEYYWDEFHKYDTCPFVDHCFITSRMVAFLGEMEKRIMANPSLSFAEVVKTNPSAVKKMEGGLLPKKQKKTEKRIVKQFEL